jgi:SPP1 family predicted phage head-tail adaptor
MPLRINDLVHEITLQAPIRAPNGKGGFTTTWRDIDTVWAAIWPKSSKEQLSAGQVGSEMTYNVRIRYRGGIKSDWRCKYGRRYFNISGSPVDFEMRHEYLDLPCKEVA